MHCSSSLLRETMTQGPNTRIENLFFTLRELENEKVCLKQKLHELKLKRHGMEQELQQADNKCAHVKEKHRRMSETFAVAQQKVDQTLKDSLSLQADVERSRPRLSQLQESIETQKSQHMKQIKDFEAALLKISTELFQARDFYTKTALNAEMENAQVECVELEQQAEASNRTVQKLLRCLDKLNEDEKSYRTSSYGGEDCLNTCYKAIKRDAKEAETYLNRIQAELKEIHSILQSTQ